MLFWRRVNECVSGRQGGGHFAGGGSVQIREKSPFIKTVSSVWKEVVGRRGDSRVEIWGLGVIWLPINKY